MSDLDKNVYLSVILPYAGHPRNGLTKVLAQALGIDAKGRDMPLITRIQQHIETLSGNANPRHPVLRYQIINRNLNGFRFFYWLGR